MNTQTVPQIFDDPQPGDTFTPLPDDLAVWLGARVDYIHVHGYWPDIETGTVIDATYDHHGWLRLLIEPDSDRMSKWRSLHDIMAVL